MSGIYQDVTSGGRTAKMSGRVTGEAASYVLYADLAAGPTPTPAPSPRICPGGSPERASFRWTPTSGKPCSM
ncbi:MAG: hypothetical protein LKI24_01650 [Acidipropionibacterium sp.]|nr:hypothetical protein [Acidipropionibacterium sp.]